MRFRPKEPMSAYTHLFGVIVSTVGLVFLLLYSTHSAAKVTGMAIYGGSLVALFLASTVYHLLDLGPRGNNWLRRFDHVCIFLLIAGTYVPALLHLLDGAWRISMLSVVGGLALLGVVFKLAWIGCPDWLGVSIYLLLGWVVVVPAWIMFPRLSVPLISCLALGGLAYSVGAAIYFFRRPDPWPEVFGFHEIWHIFVLAGAGAHFAFVWLLLDVPVPPFS
jgi:hemolysin III